jgi:hypothetical protein
MTGDDLGVEVLEFPSFSTSFHPTLEVTEFFDFK